VGQTGGCRRSARRRSRPNVNGLILVRAADGGQTFDAWDPEASAIPAKTQHALRTLEWIDRNEVLVICGPSGTGTTHLVEALGYLAIDRGKTVVWHALETLAQLVHRHRGQCEQGDRQADPRRSHHVDDVGLLTTSADGAEALFRVVDAAYEKGTIYDPVQDLLV
jgi:DNA replication protein DnaC